VITVGGGDRAALLPGGGAGSAHGLAWPGPRVVVCRYGAVADEQERQGVRAEVDEPVIGAAGAGRIDDARDEDSCGAAAVNAHRFAVGAVTGGDRVGVVVGAGVGVGDGAHGGGVDAVAGAEGDQRRGGGRGLAAESGGQRGRCRGQSGAHAHVELSECQGRRASARHGGH